jgi:hypothetical protein
MSSSDIIIYQSVSDLNDKTLESLLSKTHSAMTKGNEAMVEMCISMAEQQEHIKKTYKKADRAAVQFMVMNYVNVQPTTYFKYARAGKYYIANPDSRHLSMDAVLKKPKQLAAPAPKLPKIDYQAEYKRLSEFIDYLRSKMGEDRFNNFFNTFEKTKLNH